jgi:hypothetical protein
MASAISAHPETNDVLILDLLAEGASPAEAAAVRVERDVACRRYERGSSELEMAFDDYRDQARRVLAQAERTAEALFRVNASGRRDERPRAAAGPRRRGRS